LVGTTGAKGIVNVLECLSSVYKSVVVIVIETSFPDSDWFSFNIVIDVNLKQFISIARGFNTVSEGVSYINDLT
jgi:hypothetical protein